MERVCRRFAVYVLWRNPRNTPASNSGVFGLTLDINATVEGLAVNGFTGDPVPIGSRSGAMTHRNDHRPASSHSGTSSVNQQGTQIAVSTFADA